MNNSPTSKFRSANQVYGELVAIAKNGHLPRTTAARDSEKAKIIAEWTQDDDSPIHGFDRNVDGEIDL